MKEESKKDVIEVITLHTPTDGAFALLPYTAVLDDDTVESFIKEFNTMFELNIKRILPEDRVSKLEMDVFRSYFLFGIIKKHNEGLGN